MRRFPGALLDIAYALPEGVLTNATLRAAHPDWKVERTARRTGVLERRIAAPEQTAYDLALPAVEALLARHPGLHDAIDGILFCTQSPDYVMPSNAFLLQRDLGFNKNILALDFNLACSGYVYGLLMASSFISTGVARNILLVTADTYSKYLAEDDRSTRMLFGDGAAATWVGDPAVCATRPLLRHFDDFQCGSDGSGWDKFIVRSGANRQPAACVGAADYDDKIHMNGLQVLNFVNDRVVRQIADLLARNELAIDDVDQFFLHQASRLALDSLGNRLKIDPSKLFSNLETVGNTVSSSIPILIKDYFDAADLDDGSRVLLCGFGVGFSWGSLLAVR
jgi:3-oxoacyl-[acyl-carrier-protein] synthase III